MSVSEQVKNILVKKNDYNKDIIHYCEVLSYLPYFQEITEDCYIKHHKDKTFEYTPQFYSFIKTLYDAGLVEDDGEMRIFLNSYKTECHYKSWLDDMNTILGDDELLKQTNLCFLRKALFSIIRLERELPGSWGIDVETGNWLAILLQLKRILPEIYKSEKKGMN